MTPVLSDTYRTCKRAKANRMITAYQREQDTMVSSPARWRGARGGAGGSREVRGGEPAREGGEVTLSLSGSALPEGGNRARRYSAMPPLIRQLDIAFRPWVDALQRLLLTLTTAQVRRRQEETTFNAGDLQLWRE